MKRWAVQTVDYYESECYRDSLELGLNLFATKLDAVKELNRVIREYWKAEVYVDGDHRNLADCIGMSETGSVKYSSWNYSDDGTTAWSFDDSGNGHKGEVVELEFEKGTEK